MIQFDLQLPLRDKFNQYALACLEGGYIVSKKDKEEIEKAFKAIEEKKGVIIYGDTGTGKTLLCEILKRVIHPQSPIYFYEKNVLDIVLDYNTKGPESIRLHHNKNMLFDDLGTESMAYYFGDKVEVFEKLIQFRYDMFRNKGIITHFSTNLTPEEIKERYGKRCWSRLTEMCVHIQINDGDKRKLKNFKNFPAVYHAPQLTTEEEIEINNLKKFYEEEKSKPQPPVTGNPLGSRIAAKLGSIRKKSS